MAQTPTFDFSQYTHQQLADMVSDGSVVDNQRVEGRLSELVAGLRQCYELLQNAKDTRSMGWTGAASAAAEQLSGEVNKLSDVLNQHVTFFTEQTTAQTNTALRTRYNMPEPVPNPLSPPPDLGNPGLVGLSQSLQSQEVAYQQGTTEAQAIMNDYATETVARVRSLNDMDPLPPLPGEDKPVEPNKAQPSRIAAPPVHNAGIGSGASTTSGSGSTPAVQQGNTTTPPPAAPSGATAPAAQSRTPATTAPTHQAPTALSGPTPTGSGQDNHGPGRPPFTPVPGAGRPAGTGALEEPGRTPGGRLGAQPGRRPSGQTAAEPGRGAADPLRGGASERGTGTPGRPLAARPQTETARRPGPPLAGEPNRSGAGTPAGGGRRGKGEEDKEHRRRYGVESDEYFGVDQDADGVLLDPTEDGKFVAPPVIGEQ